MGLASAMSMLALSGLFGDMAAAMAPFIALAVALISAPLIAIATKSRYYLARQPDQQAHGQTQQCVICENHFESADVAHCPAYAGTICSLCCSLDARCNDRCKPEVSLASSSVGLFDAILPAAVSRRLQTDVGHYLLMLLLLLLLSLRLLILFC